MIRNLCLIFALLTIFSCSEDKITKEQMFQKTIKHDSTAKILLPKTMEDGIKCSDYGEGCIAGHNVLVLGLEMIVVEYDSSENAKKAAMVIDAYYVKNWLFDDVYGEPVLEKFAKKAYDAIRARDELKKSSK